MRELTSVELFYIKGNPDKTPLQLSRDLGCEISLVRGVIEAMKKQEPAHQKQTMKQPVDRNLFARRKERGFVAMTQAASERVDEFVADQGGTEVKGNEGHIHRPFGPEGPS